MHGEERRSGADRSRHEPEDDALDPGQHEQVSPGGAAGAEQRQVAPIAFRGSEGGEVGKEQRDERSGNGEHDVERLRVERVAGRCREAVREVVDELHLAWEGALDPVADPRCLGQGPRGASSQRRGIDLRLDLPLDARHGAGEGGRGRGRERGRAQGRGDRARERREGQDRDVGGRLGRRGADERVQGLEEDVGRGDERDAAHAEPVGASSGAGSHENGVAGLHLERRCELLVEHDLAGAEPAAEEPEGVDVAEVAWRHREDRSRSGADRADRRPVLGAGERRGGRGRRLEHARLVRHGGSDAERGAVRRHRPLPVHGHAPGGAARHRPQRVPDEEQHGAEQRDGSRQCERAHRRPPGRPQESRHRERRENGHAATSAATTRPSSSSIARPSRAATSGSWVATTSANPNSR